MITPLRIFVSSPSDVNPERRRMALVVEKLAKDYARFFAIECITWESEPMLASGHFQDHIVPPHDTDIVVLILWSRLGTPLPEKTGVREYRGLDGRAPVTGTEWEYEDAFAAHQKRGAPDMLAYRKAADPKVSLKDAAAKLAGEQQWQMLESFWRRNFVEFRAAFREFEDLNTFEAKVEQDLRQLIERRIASLQGQSKEASPVWLRGSPFRGLETYRYEDAPVFFGRSQATKTAVEQLLQNAESGRPFLLILGASGAGKSSLVQAGILPALATRGVVPRVGLWRRAVLRPAGHAQGPFMALAEALISETALPELVPAGQATADLARHLEAAAQDPAYPITTALNARAKAAQQQGELLLHESPRLVLVIDQLEELFTLGDVTPEQRRKFILCLDGLMRSGLVLVIATLRSDYWHRAAETPLLVELAGGRGRLDLLPATQAEITEMIRRPAEAAGLAFETDARSEIKLDAALAEDAAKEPGALPLLSFLLDALYQKDIKEKQGSNLTYSSMNGLGGLKGAIANRAEAAFTALSPEAQAALPRLLRSLVTVSRSGADATARPAPMAEFAPGSPERQIVDALLAPDMRLLVADGDGEGARVRLAHEALITHWGRAKEQIAKDRDDLRTRAAVDEAEAEWKAASDSSKHAYLLKDPKLANAVDLAKRWANELSPDIRGFIERSLTASRAAYRRRRMIVGSVIAGLALLTALSIATLFVATNERNKALIGQSNSLARDALAASDQGDGTLGTLLALAALPQSLDSPDRPFVKDAELALQDAMANREELLILRGHTQGLYDAVFSHDGSKVVTASLDHTARIFDARSGATLAVLKGHSDVVETARFSPDDSHVVTASDDHTARVWDAKTGEVTAVLQGHTDVVNSAEFSPDGTRIVTASADQTARLWDARSGALVAVLEGHNDLVNDAEYSPDGSRIVTASSDKTARIWDARTGASLVVLRGHGNWIRRATFSFDGKRVLTGSFDNTSRIWDAATGRSLVTLRGHLGVVIDAAFSPDARRVVTAGGDRTGRIWDAATGQQLAVLPHNAIVRHAEFSPDGSRVVTASRDHTAEVWDAGTGAPLQIFRGHHSDVEYARFSPDGTRVVTASEDGTARIWQLSVGAAYAVLRGHGARVWDAEFSPDGSRVVTPSLDFTARIWDVKSGRQLVVLRGHTANLNSAFFSPDGKQVLTTSIDHSARLWDASTGKLVFVLKGHTDSIQQGRFSPDGSRMVTSSWDKTARIWDTRTGTLLEVLRGHTLGVISAQFSHDGARIVTGSDDKTARVWDARSGTPLLSLVGHTDKIWLAEFSPDDTEVVTASRDGTARIWDARTGKMLHVLQGHENGLRDAKFSPDGTQVVTSADDATARVWDAKTGVSLFVLRGHSDVVGAIDFSPDGKRIATASFDGTARVWDAHTGIPIAVFRGHQALVHSVSFSPDGTVLATASDDDTARLWKIPLRCQALIDMARATVPRELTDQERIDYALEHGPAGMFTRLYDTVYPWINRAIPRLGDRCE